jgi:TRAP-type transport system periplasmic protein
MSSMTRRFVTIAAVFTLALAAAWITPLWSAQQPLNIKVGTLAYKGTSLYKALEMMREKWRKASDNRVDLDIFNPQGGEAATVKRMRARQLQAAMLTVTGLAEIDRSVTALEDYPFMFRSLDEVEYVRKNLTPDIEKRFEMQGFKVLFWGDAGWVRYFSKEKMEHPADLKKMKVFTWAGDHHQTDIMKAAGFNPVPLETDFILTSLGSGLIDVVPAPPLVAEAGQFYTVTKHMLEVNYGPLVGGAVIRKDTWDAIPPATQAALLKAAQETGEWMKQTSRAENDQAIQAMVSKHGLVVHRATPQIEAEWQALAKEISPKVRGGLVAEEMYDRVMKLLDEYRVGKGAAK